jgi:hypothetical protein
MVFADRHDFPDQLRSPYCASARIDTPSVSAAAKDNLAIVRATAFVLVADAICAER